MNLQHSVRNIVFTDLATRISSNMILGADWMQRFYVLTGFEAVLIFSSDLSTHECGSERTNDSGRSIETSLGSTVQ